MTMRNYPRIGYMPYPLFKWKKLTPKIRRNLFELYLLAIKSGRPNV